MYVCEIIKARNLMSLKNYLAGMLVAFSAYSAMAYEIYPVPRSVVLTGSDINLGSDVNIVTADESARCVVRLKEVLTKAGLSYSVGRSAVAGKTDIYIGVYGSGDPADCYAATFADLDTSVFPSEPGRYDPHILRIDSDDDCGSVLLLGDEDGSAYYACASLEQMLEQEPLDAMPTVSIADYAHARYRGIMEGFYGHPYSKESRLNLLEYCKRYKMNYYGYGPKADPYHAGNWRLEYPASVTDAQRNLGQMSSADMAELAAKARECNVDFVWIIHPSLGTYSISLSWVTDIMTKFEHMYDLGVRHFGVSVDDMSGHPYNQGQLAEEVQKAIDERWNFDGAADADRVGPVLFTPTAYALNYGASSVLSSLSGIDSKIDVAFTGYDCFSNVRAASFATMADYIGRDPVFWWNNPVNDDYDGFLYLHGLTARWTIEQEGAVSHMKGFLLNPMNQGQASKVCLFSGADYAWNPEAFDAQTSWEASLRSIVKTDENVAALRDFIRVMSAYVTHDTQTPEGEELADLYAQFQACIMDLDAEGVESLDKVEELYTIMNRTVASCDRLAALADSPDDDCRLFLIDIEPWLLKVREMASIIVDTFDALRGEVDYDRWTTVGSLSKRASCIHSDHTFSVLEGSGTSTYETFKEAQPTPKYLDPLIDYIATCNFAVTLPQRDRTPEVISNFPDSYTRGEVVADENLHEVVLSGYGALADWTPGLYIGINFNRLQAISAGDISCPAAFASLQLQYSVNGKAWSDFPADPAESVEAAYIRFVNSGSASLSISAGGVVRAPLAELQFASAEPGEFDITASTNMNTYSTYVISNILDGNSSTFFWSDGVPSAGVSYISIDLGTVGVVSGVSLLFNSSDQPSGTVIIQTSTDGSIWNDMTSFTKNDIVNNRYSAAFRAVDARYVRMLISTVETNEWLQIAEFSVDAALKSAVPSSGGALAVAKDNDASGVTSLDDRKLSTGYKGASAGYLIYDFTENLKIDEVMVFHNSSFTSDSPLPSVSMFADGQWRDCGTLDGECTHISASDYLNIERLRIEWNDINVPDIYEIMPVGDPYDERKHVAGIETVIVDDQSGPGIVISTSGGTVMVESADSLASVDVYDITGRCLASESGIYSTVVTLRLPLSSPSVVIVRTVTANGHMHSARVAVSD